MGNDLKALTGNGIIDEGTIIYKQCKTCQINFRTFRGRTTIKGLPTEDDECEHCRTKVAREWIKSLRDK